MKNSLYAAIDLGAESGRVIRGAFDGEKLQLDVLNRFANTPVQTLGTLQWDILRLWNDIQDGLSQLATNDAEELKSIGVDTWGVDFGLLDERDQLLGNPVHYRDARHTGMMELAVERIGGEKLFARTGLQLMPFNTLFQLLALKEKASPQLEIARSLLFTPDLLHFWLSGEKKSEYSIASTSQMLSVQARDWDRELLSELDLPLQVLAPIVAPGSELGNLHPSVVKRIGLKAHTKIVVPASHDTASAVLAVPAQGENWAYLSSGTWSLMGIEIPQPLLDERVREWNFTNEGGVGNTIRLLKNIAGLWLVQGCRRSFIKSGHDFSYSALTEMATKSAPLQSLVEPDDSTFAAPDDMAQAIRNWCQKTAQKVPESEGELVRCCLESLALKYRWTLERLEQLRGHRIDTLHIVGGGVQNELLCQLTADCLQRTVVAGPIEATAAGNVLTQMLGLGAIENIAQARAIVRHSFELKTYEPVASTCDAWDAAYARFESWL